jgi:hypothetical protein
VVVLIAAGGLAGYAVSAPAGWDRSGCAGGPALAARSLELQPPGTVMLLADFNLVFMFDYLIQVHHLRPDIRVIYLRDLQNPAFRRAQVRTDPDLEAALPGPGNLERSSLQKLLDRGPVALDAGPQTDPAGLAPLYPRGLTWLLTREETSSGEAALQIQREFFGPVAPPLCSDSSKDLRSADLVTWHAYWQARWARQLGRAELAGWLQTVAACASPRDRLAARALTGTPDCPPPRVQNDPGAPARRPSWWRSFILLVGLLGWLAPLVGRGRFLPWMSLAGLALTALAVILV